MASVRVAVRVRPLNQREIGKGSPIIVDMVGKTTKITNLKICEGTEETRGGGGSGEGRERLKEFVFDYSYDSMDSNSIQFASQQQVFSDLGTEVVQSAFEGYNACVFAYGQTGSGKSYTMMGEAKDPGLIPRICKGLFNKMNTDADKDGSASYRVEVSYLEIYNERVRDLVKTTGKDGAAHTLRVREHPKNGPYVQDLSKHIVMDFGDIQSLMDKGNENRTTASTNMNDTSSRSHAIFTISFTQAKFNDGMPSEVTSKVNLVDLAGSERASKTGAKGDTLREGANINKSLVTLGNVISALADACDQRAEGGGGGAGKKMVFIPYRDSVLTWLLKDSLGGNSRTIMVAAISPAQDNYGETLSTLRYANRAKDIMNKPVVNEDTNVKLIRELRAEIKRLKNLLGNVDVVLDPAIQERITENEAKAKVLTAEWTEKWQATQSLLRERKDLRIQREQGGKGVVLDSELPHLIGLNDDMLSTGITLYHLKEGATHIGAASLTVITPPAVEEEATAAAEGGNDQQPPPAGHQTPIDIILHGPEIFPLHCTIHYNVPDGQVTLSPARTEASCFVNGTPIHSTVRLMQGAVILMGSTSMFRFNHPAEAARLRAAVASQAPFRGGAGKVGQLGRVREAASCFLSKSMTDLGRINENLFYANGGEAEMLGPNASTTMTTTDANANQVVDDALEAKRTELANLQAELERTEMSRWEEVKEKERDLEEKRITLEKLSEEVAAARRKIQDEESRLKSRSQQLLMTDEPRSASRQSTDSTQSSLDEKSASLRSSVEDRPTNLRAVIEDSLTDLARKEEASLSATLNAKSAITNELKNLGEKVTNQNVIFEEWERLDKDAAFQRRRLTLMEDSLNQRRDALQWERDEELAALEKEEGSLSDLKADLARILAEQEETQEPTEERICREKASLLDAGAKLMQMEAELVDTRTADLEDVVKRKDQLEEDLRREWEELEENGFAVQEKDKKMRETLAACYSEKERNEILNTQAKGVEEEKLRLRDDEEKLMAIASEVEAMFEEEMTQIEEKADIKRKVLEKERERIKSMEKRSLHYVQQKIHEKTSWIDERKSKAEEQQRLLADLTQSSDPERVEAELARQAVHDEKVALIHSAMLEHQEAKRALEDIDKCKSVIMQNMQSEIETIDLQRKRLIGNRSISPISFINSASPSPEHSVNGVPNAEGEFRALSDEVATDAEDLEVAKLKLDETADEVERVKFDLSIVEDAERLNVLVAQEVDRRLFEEKLFGEKRLASEREEERRRRQSEIERMRRMHAREVELLKRRLKAAQEENSTLMIDKQIGKQQQHSKSNPFGRSYQQDSPSCESRGVTLDRSGGVSIRGFGAGRPRSPGAGFFLGNEIEVSIPSCALRGSGADEHYDFELHLRVGEDAWSVYRRYSKFREFHNSLKRLYPEIASLSFPPKKFFGFRNERFANERRKALEEYMRKVVHILTTTDGYPLSVTDGGSGRIVSKKTFCDFSPFFRKGIFETTKHATS